MKAGIAKPLRQLAAVALLLGVASSGWFAIARPVLGALGDIETQVDNKRAVLGRLLDIGPADAEARRLQGRFGKVDIAALLIPGDSDTLKAANLQTTVGDILAREGLRFRSSRTLPPRAQDGLRLVGMEVGFEASLEQLLHILEAVETATPVLMFTSLRMTAAQGGAADNGATGAVLDVQFEIAGVAGRSEANDGP